MSLILMLMMSNVDLLPKLSGLCLEATLERLLLEDDKPRFVYLIKGAEALHPGQAVVRPPELLREFCRWNPVKCATALIKGETGQTVDINEPCRKGLSPLHHAASMLCPELTELYLFHGAKTHLRSPNHKLPLNEALEGHFCFLPELESWTPTKHSIYKLLIILCLPAPDLQDALETVALVAAKTKETEDEILRYAREGKIIELAALLLVAREKLTRPLTTFGECISTHLSLQDREALLRAGQHLLEVFDRAGDSLQDYVCSNKTGVFNDQAIAHVKRLLQQAGFVLEPRVSDFTDMKRLHLRLTLNDPALGDTDWRPPPRDLGMPHYLSSGCRWPRIVSSKLPKTMAVVPNEKRSFHTLRILKANSVFNFPRAVETEVKYTAKAVEPYLPNALASKPWALFATMIKKLSRRG